MQYRNVTLENRDEANRTVEASLSSETPYYRPGDGHETLRHTPEAIDLSRAPLPLLTSHDSRQTPVGIIENIRIVGGKLRGLLRFGGSQRALDAWEDVKAGVLRSISVGYQVLKTERSGDDSYTVTRWMPYEASLVSVPADPTVGIGRSIQKENIMENLEQENISNLSRSQRRGGNRTETETREAAQEITALAAQFKIPSHAVTSFIGEHGLDTNGFRAYVTSQLRDTGKLRAAETPELGLSSREIERFSVVRAINALVDPLARRDAGLEIEVSRAFAKKVGRDPQGIFVPFEVLQNRDLLVSSPTTGGNIVATELLTNHFVDYLRARSFVFTLGATRLTDLNGNVSIPTQTAAATAFWVAENSAVTESQQAFGQVALTPKTVGGFTDFSRRLLLQSSPDVEVLVRRDLAGSLATEIDRVAINGSGSNNQPTGILNTAGVGSIAIGTNGGAPTWSHMLQLEESIALANADVQNMAYLSNSKVRRALQLQLKVSGDAGAGFVWQPIAADEPGWGRIGGYRAASSNNVPWNLDKGTSVGVCSAIILGNWSDLLVGLWGGLDLLHDPYTGATAGTHRIVALQDCDIALRRPVSFAVIKDALTA